MIVHNFSLKKPTLIDKVKGISQEFALHNNRLIKFLPEDALAAAIDLRKQILPQKKDKVTILSAGSGIDTIRPIMIADMLYKCKTIHIKMVDIEPIMHGAAAQVQFASKKINFTKKNNKIIFRFNNKKIIIEEVLDDVQDYIQRSGPIDIYFERAFDIFRTDFEYTKNILDLRPQFIASDKEIIKGKKLASHKDFGFYPGFSIVQVRPERP